MPKNRLVTLCFQALSVIKIEYARGLCSRLGGDREKAFLTQTGEEPYRNPVLVFARESWRWAHQAYHLNPKHTMGSSIWYNKSLKIDKKIMSCHVGKLGKGGGNVIRGFIRWKTYNVL